MPCPDVSIYKTCQDLVSRTWQGPLFDCLAQEQEREAEKEEQEVTTMVYLAVSTEHITRQE